MASVHGEGRELPIVFDVQPTGVARVNSHLLHVRFKFVESSIYMEEEKLSKFGSLLQTMPVERTVDEGGTCWNLPCGNFRAYGLPLSVFTISTEMPSQHFETSIVDMPSSAQTPSAVAAIDVKPVVLYTRMCPVKLEGSNDIIDLSSDSDEGTRDKTTSRKPPFYRHAFDTVVVEEDVLEPPTITLQRSPSNSGLINGR